MSSPAPARPDRGDDLYERYARPFETEHWGGVHRRVAEWADTHRPRFARRRRARCGRPWNRVRPVHGRRACCRPHPVNRSRYISVHYSYLPIAFHIGTSLLRAEALVDSGFDGGLLLLAAMLPDGKALTGHIRWRLADGSQVDLPVLFGRVDVAELGARPALISLLGNAPVLGRALLDQFRIVLDRGRRVIVGP